MSLPEQRVTTTRDHLGEVCARCIEKIAADRGSQANLPVKGILLKSRCKQPETLHLIHLQLSTIRSRFLIPVCAELVLSKIMLRVLIGDWVVPRRTLSEVYMGEAQPGCHKRHV